MPPPDAGKPQPARIPLNYFTRGDRLRRWKIILTIGAAVAAALWWLSGYLQSDSGRLRYSRGPVADVHAMWDDKCETCHTSFQPIRGDSWAANLLIRSDANDPMCMSCHTGPAHHGETQAYAPPCAACHQEHRGRDASLVHMADRVCVNCHKDLKAHLRPDIERSDFENAITRFGLPPQHSEFRVTERTGHRVFIDKAKDRGQLKFNHRRHMTEGMTLDPNGEAFLYKHIADSAQRERYWQMTLTSQEREAGKAVAADQPVRLECAACHRLDAEDFAVPAVQLNGVPRAPLLPPRAAGASMLPITYENQCKACHPLTIEKNLAVPHRLQPEEMTKYLDGYFTSQYLKKHPKLLERELPARLVPGKLPDAERTQARQIVKQRINNAAKVLYQDNKTCGECHHYDREAGQVVPKRIVPPDVPTIWLPHAKFSHTAHRVVECLSCHGSAKTSTNSEDVMIPGIAVCVQCHAPPSRSGGGARYDCTECHRYHHGDEPLRGIGTEMRDPEKRRPIEQLRPH